MMIRFSELPVLEDWQIAEWFELPVSAIPAGLRGKGKSKMRDFDRIFTMEVKNFEKESRRIAKARIAKEKAENVANYATYGVGIHHAGELAIDNGYLQLGKVLFLPVDNA